MGLAETTQIRCILQVSDKWGVGMGAGQTHSDKKNFLLCLHVEVSSVLAFSVVETMLLYMYKYM